MRWGTRATWRKLDCLNPNLQKMQWSIRRKDACNRCRFLRTHGMLAGAPPGGGRFAVSEFKGMSRTPKSC